MRDGEEAFTRQGEQNTQMGSVFHVAGVGLENGGWGCRCVWSAGEQGWALSCRQWAPWEVLNKGGGCLNILEGYSGDSEEHALQGEAGGREVGKGAAVAVQTLADAEGGGRMVGKVRWMLVKRRC